MVFFHVWHYFFILLLTIIIIISISADLLKEK